MQINTTLLVSYLVVYGLAGGVGLRLWQGRRLPPTYRAELMSWLAYWLPKLIALELFVLMGAVVMVVALTLFGPVLADDGVQWRLGSALGLGTSVLVFAGIDVWVIARARRMHASIRQQ